MNGLCMAVSVHLQQWKRISTETTTVPVNNSDSTTPPDHAYTTTTVSYTHLDVYKRQPLT